MPILPTLFNYENLDYLNHIQLKQEYIPVGCVPAAH